MLNWMAHNLNQEAMSQQSRANNMPATYYELDDDVGTKVHRMQGISSLQYHNFNTNSYI